MSKTDQFPQVFQRLRTILQPYAEQLTIKTDNSHTFYLDGQFSQNFKRTLFFGSVQIKKNYVSFYLMPVYMYPDLLKNISPELKRRMQGKSCFNFSKIDETLFAELQTLTQQGFARFQKEA